MAEYEKQVRKKLSENGCYLVRHGKGDHDVWFSPITNVPITVATKIDSRHTANGILKRAGINYHF
ncbi:addiction module toxin, HicA family protein [Spirochaetia bacterium]|nr:addiction module toxin, HicA family protein [Spirochaetia bacterium]GHU36216.1 addiction module toxin, HicA family protein [Spirochaetia bacterium]